MTELMQMLVKREVDFVLAFKPTRRYEQIESHILFDNHLSVIVRSDHALAQKQKVTLSELENMSSPCPAKACKPETHSTKCFPNVTTNSKSAWN